MKKKFVKFFIKSVIFLKDENINSINIRKFNIRAQNAFIQIASPAYIIVKFIY